MSSTSNNDNKLTPELLARLQMYASLPTTSHAAFDEAFKNAFDTPSSNNHVTKETRAVPPPPLPFTNTYVANSSPPSSRNASPSAIAKDLEREKREQRIRQIQQMQNASEHPALRVGVEHHDVLPVGFVQHGGLPVGFVQHGGLPVGFVHHGGLPVGFVHHGGLPVNLGHHSRLPDNGHHKNLVPEQRHSFTPTDNSVGLSRIAPHLVRF